jgi:hypothetical protein
MAALRHCSRLVHEIEAASASGLELAVRTLGRAHMEAWLTALYIHFGGHEVLVRVAQNTEYQTAAFVNDAQEFDKRLKGGRVRRRCGARLEDILYSSSSMSSCVGPLSVSMMCRPMVSVT